MTPPLIKIRDLSIGFTSSSGKVHPVLRNIDLAIRPGESVGLIGESGCGKSTLALSTLGYLKHGLHVLDGTIRFRGDNIFQLEPNQLEKLRGGQLALVPQNAGQSLTPTLRIGAQVAETLSLHSDLPKAEHIDRIIELLDQVRLPDPEAIINRFPHELSGGQQQRVAIAIALAGKPKALILDEPTTGLDVTTQAHILELLADIAQKYGIALVYVSHDLSAIASVCHRVVVMYSGEIVLDGTIQQLLTKPKHPYARGLLASIPRLRDIRLPLALAGRPKPPAETEEGCTFAERCALAQAVCFDTRPEYRRLETGEYTRCHFPERSDELARTGSGALPVRLAQTDNPALFLDSLTINYTEANFLDKLLNRDNDNVPTVNDISISLNKGETLGIVGESGSGKSTILKSIAGLMPAQSGRIVLAPDLELSPQIALRRPEHLRQIQLIFQNPDESLNPRHTIKEILAQPLKLYFGVSGEALHERCITALEQVRLGAHFLDRLPGHLSGGEKQRVAIARAFAADPEIVLCDEITSALDVSVQAAILELLNELKKASNVSFIFVSHNLSVVRLLSDRVAVLYQGRLCEIGPSDRVYAQPLHPYTEVLMEAVIDPEPGATPILTANDVVELSPPAQGCPFQRRCSKKLGPECDTIAPPWRFDDNGQAVRCHLHKNGINRK